MEALFSEFNQIYLIELLLLCSLMSVCSYATYTDISMRIVPGWSVWGLLGLGVVSHLTYWSIGETNFNDFLLSLFVGFGVGFVLYIYGFWAPGDAKIYWAIVLVLPPSLLHVKDFYSFDYPIWALLLNSLIVNFFIIIGVILYQWKYNIGSMKFEFNLTQWSKLSIQILGINGIVLGLGNIITNRPLTFIEASVSVILVYVFVSRFMNDKYKQIIVFPGLLMEGLYAWESQSWDIIGVLWLFTSLVCMGYYIIYQHENLRITQTLPIHALHEGMIPLQAIYIDSSKDSGFGGLAYSKNTPDDKEVICMPGRSISVKGVKRLQEIIEVDDPGNSTKKVEVELNMPFMPSIFLSIVITIVSKGFVFNQVSFFQL